MTRIGPWLVLTLFLGCDNGSTQRRPYSLETREGVIRTGQGILDIRVADGPTQIIGPTQVVQDQPGGPTRMVRSASLAWSVTLNGWLQNPHSDPPGSPGMTIFVALPEWSEVEIDGGVTRMTADPEPQFNIRRFVNGERYLLAASARVTVVNGQRWVAVSRVYRVDLSGRLSEPAFGFPTGTPVSQVLDYSTLASDVLDGAVRRSAPYDADVGATDGGG